jgi:hypothetical protein
VQECAAYQVPSLEACKNLKESVTTKGYAAIESKESTEPLAECVINGSLISLEGEAQT